MMRYDNYKEETISHKEEIRQLAREILIRVDRARKGYHDSTYWGVDEEDCLGAPDGMTYDDWIEEAESNLLDAIQQLKDDT